MQLPKPHAFTINYVPDLCMIECVLIKGFSLSSPSLSQSHSVSYFGVWSWLLDHQLWLLTAARPGWVTVTSDKVSDSSLQMSVSAHIPSFLPFICMRDWPHFEAREQRRRKKRKKSTVRTKIVVIIVLKWFLLLALNQLTIGHLLKKVNKPARNLWVQWLRLWDISRHQ